MEQRRASLNPRGRARRIACAFALCLLTFSPLAHSAQFALNWVDNSENEAGFSIERSSDGSNFAEVATVGANVLSYVDASLAGSTTYWFRVRAYNSTGYSSYSNVATGTTAPLGSNEKPTITAIADTIVNLGSTTGALAFTIGDAETDAASLTVSASSSNTGVVPTSGLVLAGSGASRTLAVTPASVTGASEITVTVSDGGLSATETFVVTVAPASASIARSTDGFTNSAITAQSSTFTVEFDATPSSNPMDAVFGLSTSAASSFSDMAAIVRFAPSGVIDARNGSTYTADATVSYQAGKTYHFRMVVDVAGRTYSVFVAPAGGTETLLASGYAFRTEQGSATSLANWCVQVGTTGASVAVANFSAGAILGSNTAPTITTIANRTTNEDQSTGAIAFTIADSQTAASSLTVTGSSSNTSLVPNANIVFGGSGASRTVTVTPASNQSGSATITVTVNDGALTASRTFVLTVSSVNDAPTISAIADKAVNQGASTGSIGFTIGDVESAASSLTVSATSSNTVLVPVSNIIFAGTGASRTLSVTPKADRSGTATITVTVSDGQQTASTSFMLAVAASSTGPSIVSEPESVSITPGETMVLSVEVAGNGSVTYQWYKDGVAIAGATAATYTIPIAQRLNAGTYHVVISNGSSTISSEQIVVSAEAVPASQGRLVNLSTRARVETGDNILINGFVITGSTKKRVLLRAVGPTLTDFGVEGVLPDPCLRLKRQVGGVYTDQAVNLNWNDSGAIAEIRQAFGVVGAFDLPDGSRDAAMLLDLEPGVYSVLATDELARSGVAIVELYEVDTDSDSVFANISSRGFIGTGDQVMVSGFVVEGGAVTVLARAVGPTLSGDPYNVSGVLSDPVMQIYRTVNGKSELVLSHDNWHESSDVATTEAVSSAVSAFALKAGSTDSSLVLTLPAGVYTVVAQGKNQSSGVAIVEIYAVP